MNKALSHASKRPVLSGSIALALLVTGIYAFSSGSDSQAEAPTAPMAVPVVVQTLALQDARVWSEFSGRLYPVESAEIRPEVGGRITEIRFNEGQEVKKGDVLFVIDPRPYEASLAKAEATLAAAKTQAQFASIELSRAAKMIKSQAIAQSVYDSRANDSRVASASIKSADAEVKQARLNLEYAHVKAPINGRVGRAELTVGNLVQAGAGAPLLTSVVANDNVYADFEVDEQTYMQTIRTVANARAQEQKLPVELSVQGDGHVYQGTIDSFDNHINPASGTIRARAKFANADGALVPGLFVSIRLAGGTSEKSLLVPEQALGFDQNKKFVYVVDAENKVAYREVVLGKPVGSERIVISGLQAGERVIVDGLQHVRPDAVVDATERGTAPQQPDAKQALAQ